MTSLVDRGYRLLNRAMPAAARLEVRYLRGTTVISDTLTATLSRSEIAQVVEGEVTAVDRATRWRVKASELLLENEPTLPKRGDVIEWSREDAVYVFRVLPSNGEVEAGASDPRNEWIPVTAKFHEKRSHQ